MKNTALRKLSFVSYRLRHVLTSTLFFVAVSDMLLLRLIVLCLEEPMASSYDRVTKFTNPEVELLKKSTQ